MACSQLAGRIPARPLLRSGRLLAPTSATLSYARPVSTTSTKNGGTFKVDGNLHSFHERKILPYDQKQLYTLIADVDSYFRFIPFVNTSRVLKHSGPGSLEDKSWLDVQSGSVGDIHKLEHEMKIAVYGFDEAWISHVTCEKFREVSAYSVPSNLFKTLSTTWTLTPAPSNAPHPSKSPLPHAAAPLSTPGNTSAQEDGQEPQMPAPTLVSIDLAYEFANPLYAMAASGAFQKISGKIMGAFESRVREVYGDGRA